MKEDYATEFVMECLHCYIIPIARQYVAGKYNTGYSAYINIDNIPRCDLDGALSAMGVVSYTEYDSLEDVVTSYGRDCLKAGMHWLDPDVEKEVRKYYGI